MHTGGREERIAHILVGSAAGVGHLPASADAQWSPYSGVMQPIGGATLADKGPIGASGFTNLSCAQLERARCGGGGAPMAGGEVLLVKTTAGHYAKVLVSLPAGSPDPALRCVAYQIS